jgi:hypothetical protein
MFLFKITFSATTFGFITGEDVINFCQWHADFKDVPHMPFCANIVIPNTYTANDLRLIIDNSKWTLVKQPGSGTMNFQTNPLIVSVYFISLT